MKTIVPLILLFFGFGPLEVWSQKIDQQTLIEDIQYLSSDGLEGRAAMSEGNIKAGKFIAERFKALGLSSQFPGFVQKFRLEAGNQDLGQGTNFIGFIPGTVTDDILVIMAHYDHLGKKGEVIFNGADDNASGTAALLSIAAYLAENPPNHSVMIVACDAEEKGLLGARALVRDFPFPLEQVKAVINMDMISRSDDNTLYAVGTRFYPQFRSHLLDAAGNSPIRLVLGNDGAPGEKDWSKASDHGPFHERGVPFIYFGVEDHRDYHQPTDTFENIQQDFFIQASEMILETIIGIDQSIP
ncbi:M28 family peptidase [Cyclobacterium plantarum]|uniref:M28 family peptidase n=1 Tax=Cyclobacterium plantarum TaxID=2716263 RepID=A0ABX0HDS6_9BACT|nr:M28 family peptidase [Cyclobacterium plantarum]NHE59470.1 M28 family peptidase [Cyclobacterium plantarum]